MRLQLYPEEPTIDRARSLTAIARRAIALSLAFVSLETVADTSATVAFLSDYRYRGASLTGGRPSLKLNVSADSAWGLYGGAQVAGVHYGDAAIWEAQLLANAGFARSFGNGYAWEVGLTDVTYSHQHDYDYRDWYAGVSTDAELSLRAHYSHEYYGEPMGAVYLELDKAWRVTNERSLFGHVGYLHVTPKAGAAPAHRDYFDVRAGVAQEFGQVHAELAWVVTNSAVPIVTDEPPRIRHAIEIVLSRSF